MNTDNKTVNKGDWFVNYTKLTNTYSVHAKEYKSPRLVAIMYAESPFAKEDATLIIEAMNGYNKLKEENERLKEALAAVIDLKERGLIANWNTEQAKSILNNK
jgi:hypothetical protein